MNATILAGVMTVSMLAAPILGQQRESSSCQSDVVSSTVVSTFCGHHEGEHEVLDLLILWRGGSCRKTLPNPAVAIMQPPNCSKNQ